VKQSDRRAGLLRINWSTVIALCLLTPAIVAAQSISFGIRGYAETKDTFFPTVTPFPPSSPGGGFYQFHAFLNRYSIGPTVEMTLPRSFAVQFDALRSRLEYREESFDRSFSTFSSDDFKGDTVGHAWQFPLIAKYYIETDKKMLRPYPEVGFSFRRVDGITKYVDTGSSFLCNPVPVSCGTTVYTGTYPSRDILRPWTKGIVFGGGVDIRWLHFHLQPELRYTRWLKQAFGPFVKSNMNALDLVVGFTFGK
jgi:hypothetical protein